MSTAPRIWLTVPKPRTKEKRLGSQMLPNRPSVSPSHRRRGKDSVENRYLPMRTPAAA